MHTTQIAARPLPQLAGEGGAKRRMGCGPLLRGQVGLHDRHREAFIDGFRLSAPHPPLRCPADRWVTKWTGYMGDSGSWFVCVLRLAVPVGGKREAAQFLLDDIDQADGRVVEA